MAGKKALGGVVLLAALCLSACSNRNEAQLLESAKDYLEKKDAKSAVIQLKGLLQSSPDSAEARFLLGKTLLELGDTAGAEIELKRALSLKYPDAKVMPLLARALLLQGEHRKLTDRFAGQELAEKEAGAELQSLVALAFSAQGQSGKARAAIAQALTLAPASVPAQIAQARIKANENEIDAALGLLDQLLARHPDAEALQLRGDLLVKAKRDIPAAVVAYEAALKLRPDVLSLHVSLISLHFVQNDPMAAHRQFDALSRLQPTHPQTLFYQAQFAFIDGNAERARGLMQQVLQAYPEKASVLMLAGAIELQLRDLPQAETYLGKALREQPRLVAARRLLAEVYLLNRQPGKAVQVLQPVAEQTDVDAETLTLMARASLLTDDVKKADQYFARAAKLKPDDARIRTARAMSQLTRGNADIALTELQRIATDDAGDSADLALISAYLQRHQFAEALKAIAALERKQPASPVPPDLRGRAELMRRDAAAARKAFEQALQKDAGYLPSVNSLAALDLLEKKPDAARARLDAFVKANSKNAQARIAVAELHRRTGGKPAEVGKLLADAVAADPLDAQARQTLIEHHAMAGDVKAALAAAQAAVVALPGDAELQNQLGRALLASNDVNQATTVFSKLASLHPDSYLGHLGMAELALAAEDGDAAARSARRAVELAPQQLACQRVALLAAMLQQRYSEALAHAKVIQELRPNDALGFVLEGEIALKQKRDDLAIAAFRRAVGRPNPAQAPALLHATLRQAGRAAEATKFADSWLAEHPRDVLFILHLADSAGADGDLAQASKRYDAVLQLQPRNALALNNLAWNMIREKKSGAVAVAERAVAAAPGQLAFQDTLALALAQENQHAKAIELQKQTIAKAPQTLSFRLTLAKIYLQAGELSRARSELDGLLKLGKDFAGKPEAELLLSKLKAS